MLTDKFGYGKGLRTGKAPNDDVYTPPEIAKIMLEYLPYSEGETFLEPCRGKGAIYECLPDNKDWCEIKEGRDFFEWQKEVDWIITNPPYSIFDDFVGHCCEVARNVVLLCPLSKLVSSMGRIRRLESYGNPVSVFILSASKCGFPFGFPACVVHFQKGYKGETEIGIDKKV